MNALAVSLCIAESRFYLRILYNGVVGTSVVNLHQILIDYAASTYIKVSCLRCG